MVDIRSLRYAVTLAEELHFGRAAQRHFIAAQPFGRRIRQLERDVGARLFDRTSRRVSLTPAGALFVARAQEALARVDDLIDVAREEPADDMTALRVGVLGFGLADRWQDVRDLLATWHPGLRLEHVEADWNTQYDMVRSGAVDVAVVHDIGPSDGLVLEPALDAGRYAVVPASSPLAEADRLTAADVDGRQWVRPLGRHPGLRDWAGAAGGIGRTSTVVRTPAGVPAAVATSGQLGVHGEPARRFFPHPGVRYVPLAGRPAIVSVATRENDRRRAVQAFRRACHAVARLDLPAAESPRGPAGRDRNQNGT